MLADPETYLWVDPSAGAGAFLSQLPSPRVGFDLAPADFESRQADFLDWVPPEGFPRRIVVGNPPFGRNASLAIRFFNHAAQHAEIVAMILPRSIRKPSLRRRLDRMFHLVDEVLLPDNAFFCDGKPAAVRTVFQVWERGEVRREETAAAATHPDFSFCRSADAADFAIRRVGGGAGRIFDDPRDRSVQSHHFVRAEACDAVTLLDRFRRLDFDEARADVVAVPSIARPDIVSLYTALLATGG